MRFLVPSGEGMVSDVAEHRPQHFLSLRHVGFVKDGVEDTESEMVRGPGAAGGRAILFAPLFPRRSPRW